jgi:hypothetical protein
MLTGLDLYDDDGLRVATVDDEGLSGARTVKNAIWPTRDTRAIVALIFLLVGICACSTPTSGSDTPASSIPTRTAQPNAISNPPAPTATTAQKPGATPAAAKPSGPTIVDRSGAENAVRKTYESLASKDRNAYIDSVDPQARSTGSIAAYLTFATQLLIGAKVDFEDISLRDMTYTAMQNNGTWALIKCEWFHAESPIRHGDFPGHRGSRP